MSCFHQEIISMVVQYIMKKKRNIIEKRIPLRHFLKKYFLFILNIKEIQQKVKIHELKNIKSFSSLGHGPKER